MRENVYSVIQNIPIAENVYEMKLSGDTNDITQPGQFINIKVDGLFLRRPISVCDVRNGILTIVYKVVGNGTKAMSNMEQGNNLNILVGLGNGYDIFKSGENPLLIGGGVGIPPLYYLCKCLLNIGKNPSVILGFNSVEDVFYDQEFKKLGVHVNVTTVDGTYGIKGYVTDVMKNMDYSFFYTCGPMPMFKAINKIAKTGGEFSFEERMGCGFGTCMGCTCNTISGTKRICKDGPVLEREDIIW